MKIILRALLVLVFGVSLLHGSALPEAKDLDAVLDLLKNAKTITIHGEWIPWETKDPAVDQKDFIKESIVVSNKSDIESIYSLIRKSDFRYDAETTNDFKAGVSISTKMSILVEVDNSASFSVLDMDLLICKNDKTYLAKPFPKGQDTYFTKEFGRILQRIYEAK